MGTFAAQHGMQLNGAKCKDMCTNFLRSKPFPTSQIYVNGSLLEQVTTHKVLGGLNKIHLRICGTLAGLPCYLSDLVQSLQREALSISLPNLNYNQTLVNSGLQTLLERRGQACERLSRHYLYHDLPAWLACLIPQRISDLRLGTTGKQHANTNRLLRTDRFITSKYI